MPKLVGCGTYLKLEGGKRKACLPNNFPTIKGGVHFIFGVTFPYA